MEQKDIYVLVSFIQGPNDYFTYKSQYRVDIGFLVKVPLKKNSKWAIVVDIVSQKPSFEVKEVEAVFSLPFVFQSFINQLSLFLCINKNRLYKTIVSLLKEQKKKIEKDLSQEDDNIGSFILNEEQKEIVERIKKEEVRKPFLLYGRTGSGKTFIYAGLLKEFYDNNRSGILLVPEIALANTIYNKIKSIFKNDLFILHAETTTKDRNLLMNRVLKGERVICVGIHLPLFLPFSNLGIVIVDEEHDTSYFNTQLNINTKYIALLYSKILAIPIVLSSATPSVHSLYLSKKNQYHLLTLDKKYFGNEQIPSIIHQPLLTKESEVQWISVRLLEEIKINLEHKEQTLIYINRRGSHCYLECKHCLKTYICDRCSIPYTIYHHHILKCHLCFQVKTVSEKCLYCNKKGLRRYGVGTQLIYELLSSYFPTAKIGQLDKDSKKDRDLLIERMNSGELDILIATQLVTKGYHFKHLSLIGIIWADMHVALPYYTNSEELVQKFIQLSGRICRESLPGRIVIQSIKEDPLLSYLIEDSYFMFYQEELVLRKQLKLPPFCYMSLLKVKDSNNDFLKKYSYDIFYELKRIEEDLNIKLLYISEPFSPPIFKINNQYYMHLILKDTDFNLIHRVVSRLLIYYKNNIRFIPYV